MESDYMNHLESVPNHITNIIAFTDGVVIPFFLLCKSAAYLSLKALLFSPKEEKKLPLN